MRNYHDCKPAVANLEKSDKKDIEKIITNVLTKTLNEEIVITDVQEIKSEHTVKYLAISDDKFILDIGKSVEVKEGAEVYENN